MKVTMISRDLEEIPLKKSIKHCLVTLAGSNLELANYR